VGGSSIAGRYLKATSGWNNNGNGEDKYGFSALPGGDGSSDGDFSSVGYWGFWWSSTDGNSNKAYDRYMYYYFENVGGGNNDKSNLLSVRCVKD